jgi:hypothetical protein
MKVRVAPLALLVLVATIGPASVFAAEDRFGCHIMISPQNPSSADDVDVSVSFLLRTSPPFVAEFSPVVANGSVFSITATLVVPRADDAVLQIVHMDNNTCHLGKLEPGNYSFEVYGKTQGTAQTWLEKRIDFTVALSIRTAPEYPSIAGLLLLLTATATAVYATRKRIAKNTT